MPLGHSSYSISFPFPPFPFPNRTQPKSLKFLHYLDFNLDGALARLLLFQSRALHSVLPFPFSRHYCCLFSSDQPMLVGDTFSHSSSIDCISAHLKMNESIISIDRSLPQNESWVFCKVWRKNAGILESKIVSKNISALKFQQKSFSKQSRSNNPTWKLISNFL